MWIKDIIPERVKQYDCITEKQKQLLLDRFKK